jgi:hypothetical protein
MDDGGWIILLFFALVPTTVYMDLFKISKIIRTPGTTGQLTGVSAFRLLKNESPPPKQLRLVIRLTLYPVTPSGALPYPNPYSGDSWQSTTQKLIIENQDTKSEDQVYLYQKCVPNMIQKP